MRKIEERKKRDTCLKYLYQIYEKYIQELKEIDWDESSDKKKDEIENKMMAIRNQITKLEKEKKISELDPVCENKNIALYKEENQTNTPYGYYDICLQGTLEIIGYIGCAKISSDFNNVFYYIEENYRGNNNALKALELFLPYLSTQGIKQIGIIIVRDNLPSIKTVEKLRQTFPNYTLEEDTRFLTYRFQLLKKEQEHSLPRK